MNSCEDSVHLLIA